jgi:hypothetical protein
MMRDAAAANELNMIFLFKLYNKTSQESNRYPS